MMMMRLLWQHFLRFSAANSFFAFAASRLCSCSIIAAWFSGENWGGHLTCYWPFWNAHKPKDTNTIMFGIHFELLKFIEKQVKHIYLSCNLNKNYHFMNVFKNQYFNIFQFCFTQCLQELLRRAWTFLNYIKIDGHVNEHVCS